MEKEMELDPLKRIKAVICGSHERSQDRWQLNQMWSWIIHGIKVILVL